MFETLLENIKFFIDYFGWFFSVMEALPSLMYRSLFGVSFIIMFFISNYILRDLRFRLTTSLNTRTLQKCLAEKIKEVEDRPTVRPPNKQYSVYCKKLYRHLYSFNGKIFYVVSDSVFIIIILLIVIFVASLSVYDKPSRKG
jgi:hypothetical protein